MKVVLISIGSRGDMEPFLAAGYQLKQAGHEVLCAMPAQLMDEAVLLSICSLKC